MKFQFNAYFAPRNGDKTPPRQFLCKNQISPPLDPDFFALFSGLLALIGTFNGQIFLNFS